MLGSSSCFAEESFSHWVEDGKTFNRLSKPIIHVCKGETRKTQCHTRVEDRSLERSFPIVQLDNRIRARWFEPDCGSAQSHAKPSVVTWEISSSKMTFSCQVDEHQSEAEFSNLSRKGWEKKNRDCPKHSVLHRSESAFSACSLSELLCVYNSPQRWRWRQRSVVLKNEDGNNIYDCFCVHRQHSRRHRHFDSTFYQCPSQLHCCLVTLPLPLKLSVPLKYVSYEGRYCQSFYTACTSVTTSLNEDEDKEWHITIRIEKGQVGRSRTTLSLASS